MASSAFFMTIYSNNNTIKKADNITMDSVKKSSNNKSNLDLDISSFSYNSSTGELTLSESGLNKIKDVDLSDGKTYAYQIHFKISINVYPIPNGYEEYTGNFTLVEGEAIPENYIIKLMQSLENIEIKDKTYSGGAIFDFSSINAMSSGSPNFTIKSEDDLYAGDYLKYKARGIRLKLRNLINTDTTYIKNIGSIYIEPDIGSDNSIILHIGYETQPGYIMPKKVSPGGISVKLILGSQGKWINQI